MTNKKTIFVKVGVGNQDGAAAKIFQNNNIYLGKLIPPVTAQLSISDAFW